MLYNHQKPGEKYILALKFLIVSAAGTPSWVRQHADAIEMHLFLWVTMRSLVVWLL